MVFFFMDIIYFSIFLTQIQFIFPHFSCFSQIYIYIYTNSGENSNVTINNMIIVKKIEKKKEF